MKHTRWFVTAALGLALVARGWALDIIRYSSDTDDRFVPGTYPAAPLANARFAHASLDWSGVGWNVQDPRKGATMISPKHFVAAAHFMLSGHLAFLAPDGAIVECAIANVFHALVEPGSGLTSDLYVGELTAPLPPEYGIARYAILDPTTPDVCFGMPLLVYGNRPAADGVSGVSVGVNTFEGFRWEMFCEQLFYFDQDNVRGEARAAAGDSGSPTFTVIDSSLVLIGTHRFIGNINASPATLDTFAPNFVDQIGEILGAAGYSLLPCPALPSEGTTSTGGSKGKASKPPKKTTPKKTTPKKTTPKKTARGKNAQTTEPVND